MSQKDGWRVLAVCLVLGLGTIGLYAPAFTFNYVNYDDPLYVINNPHVNHGLAGAFGWAFQAGYGHAWQPLTWLSHALDCQIFGLKPGGHHATSIVLHALNSVLVFLVLFQLTGAFWRSAVVGAFFAWHPLHVETAAWIAERRSLLCAFFWLLSLWAYARYVAHLKSQFLDSKIYYAGAVVFFALALMSAPMAVALPLILLVLDWWPLGRLAATAERPAAKQALFLFVEKIPFFLLSIAVCVVNVLVVRGNPVLDPMARLPFRIRFVTAGLSCFHYLCKSLWPADLGSFYPFVIHTPKLELIGVALVLAIVSLVAVWARKTRPYGLAGWLWFLAALFPVLNLVPTGAQPFADRYIYVPSIGLWMWICWEAYDLAGVSRQGRMALGGLCGLLLAACCVLSWRQLGSWKNEGTLLARIPQSNSNSFGHAEYADYLMRRGQLAQAVTECEKAISIVPDSPNFQVLLGDILLTDHKIDEAIQTFQAALGLDHNMEMARQELGRAFLAQNHLADAAEEFTMVIHNQTNNLEARNLLARTFLAQGKDAAAVAEYHTSLNMQINQVDTLNNLAWLLATDPHAEIRHGAEAVQLAQRACGLTHGMEPVFLGTLAAAFAETGDFDKAVEAGKKAHDVALAQNRKTLADTNLKLLELYRAHKPYREKQ
jgi:protein O-mannosyl-transferase